MDFATIKERGIVRVSVILPNRKKGAIMRRATGALAMWTFMLFLGIVNLIRYSDHGRFVDFVGISGGGATVGAALVGILGCCLVYSGKLRLADKKPSQEQPPVSDGGTDRSP